MADTELAVQQSGQIERRQTFAPTTINEAFQFADMVLMSGMAPKSYRDLIAKTADGSEVARAAVVVALQFGMEVGLAPLQALQNIASINGHPSLWGDAALALVRASGLLEYIVEQDFEAIKKQQYARCIVKRRGDVHEVGRTFSMDDAKAGGLLGKNNVWATYPARMMQMRSRAFALRDTFPDVLKGLHIAEEAMDYIEGESQSYPARSEEKAEEPVDEPIGAPLATEFYRAYKASGWTKEHSASFLKSTFGIEPPKDSRDIPKSRLKEAMDWAQTRNPDIPENMDAEPA